MAWALDQLIQCIETLYDDIGVGIRDIQMAHIENLDNNINNVIACTGLPLVSQIHLQVMVMSLRE